MSQHARPHLQTHSRGDGHSAVAGVAYRLGLRLYDERAQKWHDFRRRQLGEEIVRALTVAPEGAPSWATDPAELWNRAEAAERRKDAQVARDYRIPIPFGLTDQQAGDLAEEMARFIAQELTTAVSMGLHRDAEVDALGALKPLDKQGYHAHLYFPTRKLEELEQGDGTSAWALGAKLVLLSNKRTSAGFVERLNEKWAELANRFTAANHLPADYDHRSYVRQDLPITPQPTLGQAVTAMERRGFFTRRGDALRGDIMVPSKVYEAAHAIVLEVQHEQAVADVIRESAKPVEAVGLRDVPTHPPPLFVVTDTKPTDGAVFAPDSLVARFRAAVPVGTTADEHAAFARALKIIQVIEKGLRVLIRLALTLGRLSEEREREVGAKLELEYRLDLSRASRAAAQRCVIKWEEKHAWRVAAAKALNGSENAMPKAWRSLRAEVDDHNAEVQLLKATVQSHRANIEAIAEQEAPLRAQQAEKQEGLRTALGSFVTLAPTYGPALLVVANDQERGWLESLIPEAPPVIPSGPGLEVLELVPRDAQLRPVRRKTF